MSLYYGVAFVVGFHEISVKVMGRAQKHSVKCLQQWLSIIQRDFDVLC